MESEETYKNAILRLQQIISDIERNELDVDTLSEKVKEATHLIKFCKERLYKVDEEVQKILEELDNE